jgi:two-component system, NarL family, nitrate/nitrite response regulator NarL
MPMTHIRLLLVDDHILFREGLHRLLASEPDLDVVADCGTTDDACAIVRECAIDVVLLDFDLGGHQPMHCLTALQHAGYTGRILMVTAGMSPIQSSAALRGGASGVFLKNGSPGLLAQAIRLVANGATWFDQRLLQQIAGGSAEPSTPSPSAPLTTRQREVLEAVFAGLANKEIAVRLAISESAVKAALQQLFQKTGVRTRSQLVRIALERSFLRTESAVDDHDHASA